MSYCLNTQCLQPNNSPRNRFCNHCGSKLLLGERYRAIRRLGQGGFGRTFLAEDEQKPSKPRCVIKQLYSEQSGNVLKVSELFAAEAIRLEQLSQHLQIPNLYAYLEQDGYQYIIQEFIDGINLKAELERDGNFSELAVRELLLELLPILQFIHKNDVIHRDIKPENIIRRTWDNRLFLVDFGAAKKISSTALGKTGTVIGTAEYIAPEQLKGKAVFASDIYSLGVTCLHLWVGISPFDLYDIQEEEWIWRQYLTEPLKSQQLGKILDKMACNSLKERYRSVEEILEDLAAESSAPSFSSSSPPIPIAPSSRRPNFAAINTLSGSKGSIFSVALSPDEEKVASASANIFSWFSGKDNTVRVWDLASGQIEKTLEGHSGHVLGVDYSRDGVLIASCSNDKTIQIFDAKTGSKLHTLLGHKAQISSIAFSPDSSSLASCSDDNTVKLWNPRSGQLIGTREGNSDWFYSVIFSPDGRYLSSAGWRCNIRVWNLVEGGLARNIEDAHSSQIRCLSFSPDGKILASGSADRAIKLWEVETGNSLQTLIGHNNTVLAIAFSPDGQLLASGGQDNVIKLWAVQTGELLQTLEGHTSWVRSVKFKADGKTIISGADDAKIKIWQSS
ncbi:serine/threonine-protein kinase [Oscillatoria sp. FACHB-1406]|uniref:serine/threonine-protein kinase n=1 Tax=Oscillatoria sp. FACHB-1406 TaxID=2692846 RepID=UPI001686022A|nr:serine/threonine-protein kinase [Oscillatoria sp. FACHB-1406]MBD2576700.1 serine/threonine protein kinase [Oscillatoria sp. FACHB-1406]